MTDRENEGNSSIKSLFGFDQSDGKEGDNIAAGPLSGTRRPSVPVAKDGSRFDESCCRNGKYMVGEKGDERPFISYSKALDYLRSMPVAKWRRPNEAGNWGIVSAAYWEGDESSSNFASSTEEDDTSNVNIADAEQDLDIWPAFRSITKGPSQCKLWLEQFLSVRELGTAADGRALYLYRVSNFEYESIPGLLSGAIDERRHPIYSGYWSSVFCLYIAETYRRDYRDWSWSAFEEPLGIELNHADRKGAVNKGLSYWKRELRIRDTGWSDYLGTLFDEGGLPWRLVQSDSHGFARAIRGTIRQYYTSQRDNRDLVSVVAAYAQYFPQTFQTPEKYQLIASVAQWMVGLAEEHPIQGMEDPAAYLDKQAPEWRIRSPLPVGEENARRLLNDWLKDAGKAKAEKAAMEADARNYTCEHTLLGDYRDWHISTRAFLPSEIKIQLEDCGIKSTRLEVAFYEGDSLLSRAGILYGQVNDERTSIIAKIDQRTVTLDRKQPDLPLIVRFLSNGDCIEACHFDGSEIDYRHAPLVFIKDDEQAKLSPVSSGEFRGQAALVSIPESINIASSEGCTELGHDQFGVTWVEITSSLSLSGNGSTFNIQLSPTAPAFDLALHGALSDWRTLPNVVYRGWPRLESSGLDVNSLSITANGERLVSSDYRLERFGCFNCVVQLPDSSVLMRRKIGVLPPDLKISTVVGTGNKPASIILNTQYRIHAEIEDPGIHVECITEPGRTQFLLEPKLGGDLPDIIPLSIREVRSSTPAITIRVPTPVTGASLLDNYGNSFKASTLLLDKLIETSLLLTPRPGRREHFFLDFELIGASQSGIKRHYQLEIFGSSRQISLYSYFEDISQMLATTSNQDAAIRLKVETDTEHLRLDIVRHNAYLEGPNENGYSLIGGSASPIENGLQILCIKLSDPACKPVVLDEVASEGVGIGRFQIPYKMMTEGPWLLVPEKDSEIRFRPALYLTEDMRGLSVQPAASLHDAARRYNPQNNPEAFAAPIDRMARDWGDSGWTYLASIKDRYSHLPLSSFECWKALASNERALAAACFRLDIDSQFCLRMVNELAVIWESISIDSWQATAAHYREYLKENGIDDTFIESLLRRRVELLSSAIPCFKYLATPLLSSDFSALPTPPLEGTLPLWYQGLRRRHADDPRWPTWFADELSSWVAASDFPPEIKAMVDVPFATAVTYTPIFMACLTAGVVQLTDLAAETSGTRFAIKVLSEFDREGWFEPVYSTTLSNILVKKMQGIS
tara:strand:- start:841 stop:4593 length:3753 start_codon:yes stop_codon:yes gene_type:complete